VTKVVFSVDGRRIGVRRAGQGGLYTMAFATAKLKKGAHHLVATAFDAGGRKASARLAVRACG
jgi:hypothetical protein